MLLLLTLAAHAGTTTVEPGQTLENFVNSLLPGDVLEFADGRYELEVGLDIVASGAENQPVVFRAASGATPVLAITGSDYAMDLQDTTYVTVQGLTFEGPAEPADGFWAGGVRVLRSTHVRLEGLKVRQLTGAGLRVEGDCADVTITGNAITDMLGGHGIEVGCWDASCWMAGGAIRRNWIGHLTGGGTGIVLHHGSQAIEVTDNVLAELEYRAIYAGSTEYGPPNVVEGNAIFAIDDDAMFLQGAARVRNNVILQASGAGIHTLNDPDRGGLADVVLAYNTIADTGDWALFLEDWPRAPGMVASSNLIGNPPALGLWYPELEPNLFTDNHLVANVISGTVELDAERFPDAVIQGGGWDDFQDVFTRDVYPTTESTAIDAGDASSRGFVPAVDFNGVQRDGTSPDAGAYAYISRENPGWAIGEGFKVLGYTEEDRTADLGGGCCSGGDGGKAWLLLPLLVLAGRRRR